MSEDDRQNYPSYISPFQPFTTLPHDISFLAKTAGCGASDNVEYFEGRKC